MTHAQMQRVMRNS